MQVLSSVAWLYRQDNKVLCARSRGKDKFFIPGGKFEPGESNHQALIREVKEELSIELKQDTIEWLASVEDVAYGLENTNVIMHCYIADFIGEIKPCAEIEALSWMGIDDLPHCAPAAQQAVKLALESE